VAGNRVAKAVEPLALTYANLLGEVIGRDGVGYDICPRVLARPLLPPRRWQSIEAVF
jgi:hypothetical protein